MQRILFDVKLTVEEKVTKDYFFEIAEHFSENAIQQAKELLPSTVLDVVEASVESKGLVPESPLKQGQKMYLEIQGNVKEFTVDSCRFLPPPKGMYLYRLTHENRNFNRELAYDLTDNAFYPQAVNVFQTKDELISFLNSHMPEGLKVVENA